jgi:hypothetical protein
VSWKLDTILARRCPEGCYRLEDPEGGLVGCAPRASNLERFAAAVGARMGCARRRKRGADSLASCPPAGGEGSSAGRAVWSSFAGTRRTPS